MEYILHVTIDDKNFDGDDSVESAARYVTDAMRANDRLNNKTSVARPLSELFSC